YHRTQVKMRQLAEEAKIKEVQEEAREPIAIAIPAPTPVPAPKEEIAPDTTVKFFPAKKTNPAQKVVPAPFKATSSPNKVFVAQSELKLRSEEHTSELQSRSD